MISNNGKTKEMADKIIEMTETELKSHIDTQVNEGIDVKVKEGIELGIKEFKDKEDQKKASKSTPDYLGSVKVGKTNEPMFGTYCLALAKAGSQNRPLADVVGSDKFLQNSIITKDIAVSTLEDGGILVSEMYANDIIPVLENSFWI